MRAFLLVCVVLVAVSCTLAQSGHYNSQYLPINLVRYRQNVSFRTNPLLGTSFGSGFRQGRNARVTFVTSRPQSSFLVPTTRARSASLSQFTSALTPRRECASASATCTYYYNCKTRTSSPNHFCMLDNGFTGICCDQQSLGVQSTSRQALRAPQQIRVEVTEVQRIIDQLQRLENELHSQSIMPKRNTKEFSHQNFFGGNEITLREMQNAFQVLQGFINFSRKERLSIDDIVNSNFDLRKTNFASACEKIPTCNQTTYRVPDGTCNNLINPAQGKSVSTFGRLLPPEYSDGISQPRRAKDGSELPNPRLISLSISPEANIENNKYSLLLMQFGQFLDHDISRTAITRTHNDEQISCCDEKVLANPRLKHPACFPIPVPAQDSFLRSEAQQCINFVRSAPAVNPKCRFGPREQLNQLSSYLDGNNIYGANQKEADDLREFRGGRLRVSLVNNEEFLPLKMNDTNCQLPKNSQMKCFLGGDSRVNEVTDLAVLHAAFLREHNRIARDLSQLNPAWGDETLYQETKRIVVAQFQHIIYNEFVPLILGPRALTHFNLHLSNGYTDSYNPIVDVTLLNEFATAAYRLHSLIQGTLNLNTPDNQVLARVLLRDQFNNPGILYHQGGYEMRIAGLTGQAIQTFDNFFSREITNHLFQIAGKRFGLDLVALNIQRGRDHGIPGYVKYREICGLSKINSFDDLKRIFSNPQVPDVMRQLYSDIEDIDLFIAGSSEKVLPGAVVGPTFACIIGEQFRRIKEGDRFWYENNNQAGSFTPAQVAEIKKASLARILCDNSRIQIMQPNVLLMPGANNPKVSCDGNDIPRLNLRAWAN